MFFIDAKRIITLRGKFYIIPRKKANSENFTMQNFFIPF